MTARPNRWRKPTQRAVVRWEDPPDSRNANSTGGRPPGSEWDTVAEILTDEPGRWAVVYEGDRNGAIWIRTKIIQAAAACFRPQGSFAACMRREPSGSWTVYARRLP